MKAGTNPSKHVSLKQRYALHKVDDYTCFYYSKTGHIHPYCSKLKWDLKVGIRLPNKI